MILSNVEYIESKTGAKAEIRGELLDIAKQIGRVWHHVTEKISDIKDVDEFIKKVNTDFKNKENDLLKGKPFDEYLNYKSPMAEVAEKKPPIGPKPKHLFELGRAQEIAKCINDCLNQTEYTVNIESVIEWSKELTERLGKSFHG